MSKKRSVQVLFLATVIVLWFLVYPPRWWLNIIKPVDLTDPAQAGDTLVEKYNCRQCHVVEGEGKFFGPTLKGVTNRLDAVSLRLWLRDPRSIKWQTSMPNFNLSDPEIEAIVSYLKAADESLR